MANTEVRTQSDIQNLPIRRYDELAALSGISHISWASIFCGTVIGLVTHVWLSMLGVAIGASSLDPLQGADPKAGLGAGSVIWLAVSVVISSYVGGWVAGRFASTSRRLETLLHGAASWALSNIAAFVLIGSVFSVALGGLGRGAISSAREAAGTAAPATEETGAAEAPSAAEPKTPEAVSPQEGQSGGGQAAPQGVPEEEEIQAPPAGQAQAGGSATTEEEVAATPTPGEQPPAESAAAPAEQPSGGSPSADQAEVSQPGAVAEKVAATGWAAVILMLFGLLASLGGAAMATPSNSAYNRQSRV